MRLPSFALLYLIVGVVVAAVYDYFESLGTIKRILEAVIAILIWPLVLIGIEIDLR